MIRPEKERKTGGGLRRCNSLPQYLKKKEKKKGRRSEKKQTTKLLPLNKQTNSQLMGMISSQNRSMRDSDIGNI